MAWNKNCLHAPSKDSAKHCKATNTGKRYTANQKRKTSGIIGKGYFGCPAKCRMFEPKSGLPAKYVMNEGLVKT